MIQLYLSINKQLATIKDLPLIDIVGTNEAKLYPAAFVNLGKLNYEQLHNGSGIANLPITIKVELNPIHRSGSNSPMLDALKNEFSVVEAVKSKLLYENVDFISGIMLTGEDLRKDNGKYIAQLDFIGTVQYDL